MTLTAEQVDAVNEDRPVKCLLPEAGAERVILRADVFEQLRDEYNGWTTDEAGAAFCKVAGSAGWDDPEMELDSRSSRRMRYPIERRVRDNRIGPC